MQDIWLTDYQKQRRCDHCEREFIRGVRITYDPNKVPSKTPGVAYLCLMCREQLDADDADVTDTVVRHLTTPVAPSELSVAEVLAVDPDHQHVTVRFGSRTLTKPYFPNLYPDPKVGDKVELNYLARTYPEESDNPVNDDEWMVMWKLPRPTWLG
jgi:hypothetical protein